MRSRSDITALKTLIISGGHTLSLVSGDVEDRVTFQLERLVSEGLATRDSPKSRQGTTYRITALGKKVLQEFEDDQKG